MKLRDSHLAGYEYEKWDFMRRELKEVSALNSVSDATFKVGDKDDYTIDICTSVTVEIAFTSFPR